MRRQPRPGRRRWAVAGLTTAGLLASVTTGIAQADDTQDASASEPIPVTISGPDRYALSVHDEYPPDGESSFEIGLRGPGAPVPDEDGVYTAIHHGDFTVTIDASGLEGVADVDLPCAAEGLVATCSGSELYAGDRFNPEWGVRLAPSGAAEAGDTGVIRVTGEGEGLEFTEHTVNVLVGGPEFEMRSISEPEGFAAGDVYRARLGFRNVGGVSADGVVLRFGGTRGLTFPQRFSNCAYTVQNPDDLIRMRRVALCTFEGTFDAGAAYRVAMPVKVKTADFALGDIFYYHFTALDPSEAAGLRGDGSYEQGDGPALTLEPVEGDGGTYARYAEIDLATHNTYDLDLTGDRVAGAAGDTLTAEVTLHNYGPAWIGSLRAGGEPFGFTVEVPEGATVTQAPDGCGPHNEGGEVTTRVYLCWADTPILEQDTRKYPFELRIDEVVEGATGRIAFPDFDNPWEGDPSNDDGWIVLNGTGDEQTPGDTGGSDGADDDTDGSDDASGGDDGDGGTSANGGTGGDSTDSGTGTDGGSLALTGTTAMTLGGVALALMAAGGALLVVRRRRAATVTTTDDATV